MTDESHRAELRSWVESANDGVSDFPIQNLPFGCFLDTSGATRAGVAIGDRILALDSVLRLGLLDGEARTAAEACASGTLNGLMALGSAPRRALRSRLVELLRADGDAAGEAQRVASELLLPADSVTMTLPAVIGDYTDFYASIDHATNVGSMFRPDNPLLPNYKYVPIGYHGRASSIVPSGTPIRRPRGQTKGDGTAEPSFGPTARLDYEVEVGAYVARGNALGEAIPLAEAKEHIFGLCLVNDWSARDVQAWEYQPLGPFLAKNFATTVSPWIVTMEALAPSRAPARARPAGDPAPLPYLDSPDDRATGAFDIRLEAFISSARMREQGMGPMRLSTSRFTQMYWTLAQMLAHHASGGCNMRPGDLIASGTVSGPENESRGCLLERTWRGTEPIQLPTGETRRFLDDGDEVVLRGQCERDGFARIGFGECRGTIRSATP